MKAGIITQARMTSTRLPEKILLEIKGKPVLKYHIDRLKESGIPVYVATTVNKTDQRVVDFCRQEDIPCFRGDEQDVLSRFYGCASQYDLDVVIRVTSDCPLIDGTLIRRGMEVYVEQENDRLYLSNTLERTYPRGFDFEIFSFDLLKEAFEQATLPEDKEHVTPFLHQNRTGTVEVKSFNHPEDKSQYRITLDTPDDFELIRRLIVDFDADEMDCEHIIGLMDQHPELAAINVHVEQKKLGE